jgi:hypothetical protein
LLHSRARLISGDTFTPVKLVEAGPNLFSYFANTAERLRTEETPFRLEG